MFSPKINVSPKAYTELIAWGQTYNGESGRKFSKNFKRLKILNLN